MDKISISNLFPYNDFKPLSIHTLYNTKETMVKNKISFNVYKLIEHKEKKRKKLLRQYDKLYNICLNKINSANTLNKAEVVYEVPFGVYGYYDYDSYDCLLYISDKLRDMFFDTIIYNKCSIYISWAKLEQRLNEEEENKRKEKEEERNRK